MRDVEVPEIEDPERFFPDPVLVKRPEYRVLEDGSGELRIPGSDKWKPIHAVFVPVLQGLEAGLTFDEIAETLPAFPEVHITKKVAAKLARKFCWNLQTIGIVSFPLEAPPEIFHDRYERLKELGRGGLGIAHLCKDTQRDDALVVVKHPWGIKAPILSGQKALAVEIAVMEAVDHPLVPHLHDHFTDRGLLHIVRDYVDGEKLSSSSVRRRMRDPTFRNHHMRQICEGLHAVHEAGFLFFDPSPDNFFLVGDQVVTADPGGCREHEGGEVKVGGARGTPGYVAREMRDSRHPMAGIASVRSDIWSIGCLHYHYVVGRRPKRAWFHDEIMASLDEIDIRPEDRHLIDLCTRDDPAERPPDMMATAELLR